VSSRVLYKSGIDTVNSVQLNVLCVDVKLCYAYRVRGCTDGSG
jgi:hypothetical protein